MWLDTVEEHKFLSIGQISVKDVISSAQYVRFIKRFFQKMMP